ncbi:hypothetical protein OSTOST_20726, partial [Ostertagia ostertagi]
MLHCYTHTLWSLLFSFGYRYYVLSHPTPRPRIIIFLISLIYIPSFFQFVSFCFASDDISEVRQAMAKHFNYNVTSQCVTGHVSIFKWSVMYSNLHMTLPVIPVYIAVLVLRRLTIVKLHSDTALSEKTKHLHKQLL